ncbi:hypothetical protein AMS62_05015 [Bacillus sp. FJAT-18019]|nr:hypothetical protein AMS62_05015 [Bacillus sp. FJAT-18019]
MHNLDHEDEKLKVMLKRSHTSLEIPNGKESWLQVQAKLNKIGQRTRVKRRMKLTAAMVACSLVISFIMNPNFPAAYAKFASLLKKVQGDIIRIFHESPDQESSRAKTLPPGEDMPESTTLGSSSTPEKMSLEEASNKVAFPLLTPSYVPESFILDAVFVARETNGAYQDVYFEYLNEDGELLKIGQQQFEGNIGAVKTEIDKDSGEFSDVYVGEYPAVIFEDRNGSMTTLEWLTKNRIKIYISGPISRESMLKVGASLK